MYKETKTKWLWTEKAERVASAKKLHRKAGTPLMDFNKGSGTYVKSVPRSWVENGYVVEAEPEQGNLF